MIQQEPRFPSALARVLLFGFQGALLSCVSGGVDGVYHPCVSGKQVQIISHLANGIPKSVEGIRSTIQPFLLPGHDIEIEVRLLDGKHHRGDGR